MATCPEPYEILCVCTGNICRSPAAERLLAAGLGDQITVTSAGTHALVGQPISEPMAELVAKDGARADEFSARWLTEGMIRRADLVLGLERAHRGAVVELWPGAVRRTFTLLELARLLGELDPSTLPSRSTVERLRAAVALAGAARHRIASAGADDVIDPYRQSSAIYQQSFDAIARAVGVLVTVSNAVPAVRRG